MELKYMKETTKKQLTDLLNESIHPYFVNRISKKELVDLNGNHRSLYFAWYLEWVKHISHTQQLLWETIRKQKNNLVFINSIFVQFDYLLQTVESFENTIEPPTVRLESYFEYANDVYIEAFGKALPLKDYKKNELLSIIKESEKVIHSQFINNTKPSHNVRTIQV